MGGLGASWGVVLADSGSPARLGRRPGRLMGDFGGLDGPNLKPSWGAALDASQDAPGSQNPPRPRPKTPQDPPRPPQDPLRPPKLLQNASPTPLKEALIFDSFRGSCAFENCQICSHRIDAWKYINPADDFKFRQGVGGMGEAFLDKGGVLGVRSTHPGKLKTC